jgi:hypothetical protein
MAAAEHAEIEQDLHGGRQAILRALSYVRSQMAAVRDQVACIEKQIGCVEENVTVLRQSHGKAA